MRGLDDVDEVLTVWGLGGSGTEGPVDELEASGPSAAVKVGASATWKPQAPMVWSWSVPPAGAVTAGAGAGFGRALGARSLLSSTHSSSPVCAAATALVPMTEIAPRIPSTFFIASYTFM